MGGVPLPEGELGTVQKPLDHGFIKAFGHYLLKGFSDHLAKTVAVTGIGILHDDGEHILLHLQEPSHHLMANPRLLKGQPQRGRLVIDQCVGNELKGHGGPPVGIQIGHKTHGQVGVVLDRTPRRNSVTLLHDLHLTEWRLKRNLRDVARYLIMR